MKAYAGKSKGSVPNSSSQAAPSLKRLQRSRSKRRWSREEADQASPTSSVPVAMTGWANLRRNQLGSAKPLSSSVLRQMNTAFKADFGHVRVYEASPLADRIGAEAFASGNEVHFAPGRYAPRTDAGRRLLAHELTHTLQQGEAEPRLDSPAPIHQASPLEAEAEGAAQRVGKGEQPQGIGRSLPATGTIQGFYKKGSSLIANDRTVAIKGQKELYAVQGKADVSNKVLSAAGSTVELVETATEREFKGITNQIPRFMLRQVLPKNKDSGKQGREMDLWADCGKACTAVGGTNTQTIVTAGVEGVSPTYQRNPISARISLMNTWLDQKASAPDTPKAQKAAIEATILKTEKLNDLHHERSLRLDVLKALDQSAVTPAVTEEVTELTKQIEIIDFQVADVLWGYYKSLTPDEKLAFDAKMGINRFAAPTLGEGYLIVGSNYQAPAIGTTSGVEDAIELSQLGKPWARNFSRKQIIPPQSAISSTYNFHYATVVMQSTDLADQVTLENFATETSKPDTKNQQWVFNMNGKAGSKESFHDARKSAFGTNPVTFKLSQ